MASPDEATIFFVGGIAVVLHDATITLELLELADCAAPRSVAEGDSRRIGTTPGAIVPGDAWK